jgi:beta-lactamase superfamily II metal-dependent hydrolase
MRFVAAATIEASVANGKQRSMHQHETDSAQSQQAAARTRPPAAAVSDPRSAQLAFLQRSAGNAAVASLVGGPNRTRHRPRIGPTPRSVQRQQQPKAATGLDDASRGALLAAGVILSDEDDAALAQAYPGGVVVEAAKPVIVGMRFSDRIEGRRLIEVAVKPKTQAVTAGVEAHIFQVGKGRSILVSSIGGKSVLMDVGSGQATSVSAPSVQRLVQAIGAVTAGGTAVPELIKLSHSDVDHYGAARALLQQAAYSRAAVEVAVQQLGAPSAGKWTTSSLVVQPDQRIVTVNVSGEGVQVRTMVIDNMELIEFRSVQAASRLAQPGRRTFNRNASSPVVVVRDLVSGNRMLFTADAEGHQFTEMVNAVGPEAMRRILGAEGHNLKLMEAPHHFGQQAGADATGMLNMLELAYESGKGDLRLFAQTTQNFANKPSSSYSFLESTGLAPERVQGDPSGGGQSQVTRARGSQMQQITLDLAGVQQVVRTLEARETTLRNGYGRLGDIASMRAEVNAMREALTESDAPKELQLSIASTDEGLQRHQDELRAACADVWNQARTAAAGAGEMSSRATMSGVEGSLGRLETRLSASLENLTKVANNVEAHRAGLTLYSRLYTNASKMVDAMARESVAELYAARAEHTTLVAAAAGSLGPAVVDEHVRAAWAATRAQWTAERIEAATSAASRLIVSRKMSAEMRTNLSVSLARQAKLNEMVVSAESGGRRVYGNDGVKVTPKLTKGGAGVFIALEVIRIGLDVALQLKTAADAAAKREKAAKHAGVATMNWWLAEGVEPTVALANRSSWDQTQFNIVYEGENAKAAATSETRPKGVPEFDMVVVTELDAGQLHKMVVAMVAQLANLEDWTAFVGSNPSGPAFEREGDMWKARLFDKGAKGYVPRPVDAASAAELGKLYTALEAGQEAKLKSTDGGKTIKNTAVFSSLGAVDRDVYVYDSRGRMTEIDFEEFAPKFSVVGTHQNPIGAKAPLVKVRAADMPTYRYLSPFFWVDPGTSSSIDESGTVNKGLAVSPNSKGFAFVRPDQLTNA